MAMRMTRMTTTMTSKAAKIGDLALESLLVEVSVTPKPGLVDRNNSGAHSDMGFFTFMKSAASLRSCFEEFALAGVSAAEKKSKYIELFDEIRKIGLKYERKMFRATQGVNTHKGEIFSLGVLSASAGCLIGLGQRVNSDGVCDTAAKVCAGLCERDFSQARTKTPDKLTKGEKIFVEHGIKGVRGEAESGYSTAKTLGLQAFKNFLEQGMNLNDALAMTLVYIMAFAQDTNIIARHNVKTSQEVMNICRRFFENHGNVKEIKRLDNVFINSNVSPGGSGDLLAVTYFLYRLDSGVIDYADD